MPLGLCLLPSLGQEPPCILETQALGRCRRDLGPEPEPGRLSPGRAFIPSRLLTPGASKRNPGPSCKGSQSRLSSTISPRSPCPTLHTAAREIPSNFRLHLGQSCHPFPKSADPAQASQQHSDPPAFLLPSDPTRLLSTLGPWHRWLPSSGPLFPFLSSGSQLRNLSPESSVSDEVFEGCGSLFHILFASLFSKSNQQQKATLSPHQTVSFLWAGVCVSMCPFQNSC